MMDPDLIQRTDLPPAPTPEAADDLSSLNLSLSAHAAMPDVRLYELPDQTWPDVVLLVRGVRRTWRAYLTLPHVPQHFTTVTGAPDAVTIHLSMLERGAEPSAALIWDNERIALPPGTDRRRFTARIAALLMRRLQLELWQAARRAEWHNVLAVAQESQQP